MRFLSLYKPGYESDAHPSEEHLAAMLKLIEETTKSGELLTTEGCYPSKKGARVRISGGKFGVIDGPFTEAKELIGGFAIFQANSKEEAIEFTKRFLKTVGEGECEIRQLHDESAFGPQYGPK
jgi:hypothetical protein